MFLHAFHIFPISIHFPRRLEFWIGSWKPLEVAKASDWKSFFDRSAVEGSYMVLLPNLSHFSREIWQLWVTDRFPEFVTAWRCTKHDSSYFIMIPNDLSEQSRYASLLNSKKLMCRVVGWLLQNVTCLLVKLSTHIFETHQVLVMLQYMLKSCWYILPSSPRGVSGHGDLLRSIACIAFHHTGCQANALLGSWPKKASHYFSRVVYIQTTMWLCHMYYVFHFFQFNWKNKVDAASFHDVPFRSCWTEAKAISTSHALMQNIVETCSFVVQHLLSSAKHDEWRHEGISSFNSWVHYRRPRDIFGLLKWPDDTWCFCSSLLTSQVLAGKPNQRWCCQRRSGETEDGDLWSLENIRWLTNTRLRAYYLPWCLQAFTRKMQKHNKKTIITLNSQLNHTKTYSIISYKIVQRIYK